MGDDWKGTDDWPATPRTRWRTRALWLGVLVLACYVASQAMRFAERRRTESLLQEIASSNAKARELALHEVRYQLGPTAAPAVAVALRSGDRPTRRAAVLASRELINGYLGSIGTMNCACGVVPSGEEELGAVRLILPPLAAASSDDDAALRLEVARALAMLADHTLARTDPAAREAVPALTRLANDGRDPDTRRIAAEALSRIEGSKPGPP